MEQVTINLRIEIDLLNKIDANCQGNRSKYIRRLIQADITKHVIGPNKAEQAILDSILEAIRRPDMTFEYTISVTK